MLSISEVVERAWNSTANPDYQDLFVALAFACRQNRVALLQRDTGDETAQQDLDAINLVISALQKEIANNGADEAKVDELLARALDIADTATSPIAI